MLNPVPAIANYLQQFIPVPIYPGRAAPADTPAPYVCIYKISTPHDEILQWPRIQVSIWADDYTTVNDLTDQVIARLNWFRGTLDPGLPKVLSLTMLDSSDNYDPNSALCGIDTDFQIIFEGEG